MRMLVGRKMAVAAIALAGTAGVATMAWASLGDKAAHDDGAAKRELTVILDGGKGERVEISDLAQLSVGDSRSYISESGKSVIVTRDENGYVVDLDGKKLRIGDEPDAELESEAGVGRMKRIEIESDGEGRTKTRSFVLSADPDQKVVFIAGQHGEHGFAFGKVAAPPPELVVDGLLARLERSEKFRALDDATRELVREAIRESARDLDWAGAFDSNAEGATKVIVKERVAREGESSERK